MQPNEGGLRVGQVSFRLFELCGLGALGLLSEAFWLDFAYGYSDPVGDGIGYLSAGVPITFAILGILFLLFATGKGAIEALKCSQSVTLLAGVAAAVTGFLLANGSAWGTPYALSIVLCLVHNAGLMWCLFIAFHILGESHSVFKQLVMLHMVPLVMFVANALFFMFGTDGTVVLYVAYPLAGSVLLVAAAALSPREWFAKGAPFWFVSPVEARARDAAMGIDIEAPNYARNDRTKKYLVLLLVSIFIMSFYIAFVRAYGMSGSVGTETHSVGASAGLGLVAIFFLVVLSIILITGKGNYAHLYYLVSGVGLFFAAVVLILFGNANYPAVRVIEDICYQLYAMAIFFALMAWVASMRLYVSRLFARAGSVFAFGTALGWLFQRNLYFNVSADISLIVMIALTFVGFAYMALAFTPRRYRELIEVGLEVGEQLADKLGETNSETDVVAAPQGPAAADEFQASTAPEQSTSEASDTTDSQEEPPAALPADEHMPPRRGVSFREATSEAAKRAGLSKREVEILHLLLKGYSDQRIAEELTLSYHTVRSHVRHVYVKMDVHNREEISDYINAVQLQMGSGN